MPGEIQVKLLQVIDDPEIEPLLGRYRRLLNNSRAFYEELANDLENPREQVRREAFWVLVATLPEIPNILYVRETSRPGSRNAPGQDQETVNQTMDILTHLYKLLVTECGVKTDGMGKDPRVFVKKVAKNWRRDEVRKKSRELSLEANPAFASFLPRLPLTIYI